MKQIQRKACVEKSLLVHIVEESMEKDIENGYLATKRSLEAELEMEQAVLEQAVDEIIKEKQKKKKKSNEKVP